MMFIIIWLGVKCAANGTSWLSRCSSNKHELSYKIGVDIRTCCAIISLKLQFKWLQEMK